MPLSVVRWSGPAAMLGGALWGLKAVWDGVDAFTGPNDVADVSFFIVPLLLLAGLAGLYARYAEHLAGVGQAGFIQGFIGLGFLVAGSVASFSLGVEGAEHILSFGFFILALGLVLLGFDTLKTEALPRWNFLPLVMGMLIPLSIIAGDLVWLHVAVSALFGLGWALLGYLLWSKVGAPGGEP